LPDAEDHCTVPLDVGRAGAPIRMHEALKT
jgi:hypothetical protein